MKISAVFWNTSLSPTSQQNRSSNDEKEFFFEMLHDFIYKIEADIIALAEISESDLTNLEEKIENSAFNIVNGTEKLSRLQFDICILYNKEKLELIDKKYLVNKHGSKSFKLGQYLKLKHHKTSKIIYYIFSHWPSRIHNPENAPSRQTLGIRLRDEINAIYEEEDNPSIILAGDYNDEPFSDSISHSLLSTRDKQLVAKKPHLLYNPFWRDLSIKEISELEYESQKIKY